MQLFGSFFLIFEEIYWKPFPFLLLMVQYKIECAKSLRTLDSAKRESKRGEKRWKLQQT